MKALLSLNSYIRFQYVSMRFRRIRSGLARRIWDNPLIAKQLRRIFFDAVIFCHQLSSFVTLSW